MKKIIFILILLMPQNTMADDNTKWVIRLDCNGWDCYAAGNSSFASINGANRFKTYTDAERFFKTLTTSIKNKNPRIVEIGSEDRDGGNTNVKGLSNLTARAGNATRQVIAVLHY